MAELHPFRGVRYDPAAIGGDLSAVLAPPFDVISPEEQEALYHRSPYNIVRVEYPQGDTDASAERNRYAQAAAALQAWRSGGQLRQDSRPAFYLVRHEFTLGGRRYARRELMVTVRAEPWERKVVLPHELTLPQAKADRLNLYRACKMHISPVYSLYDDAGGKVAGLLHEIEQRKPEVDTGWGASSVRLWVIDEPAQLASLQQVLQDKSLYIADGHHRYETALNYASERAGGEPAPTGNEEFRFVLMGLTAAEDPGLVLLPLHRLVRNVRHDAVDVLRGRLEEFFEVTEIPHEGNVPASARAIEAVLAVEAPRRPTLGLYGLEPDQILIVAARDANYLRRRFMPSGWSESVRELDVSLLHHVILDPMLGLGPEAGDHGQLAFEPDMVRAIQGVDEGRAQLAFLLHPTRVDQVTAVADAGEKMPAKSTFFFPKLPTGLVLHALEGDS